MSETIKALFESLRAARDTAKAIAPGLKDFGQETSAELSRLGTQGAMEISSALFNGHAFVPYGPGAYAPPLENQQQQETQQDQGIER